MIFKGGGDCSKVDWTFLGGSIANWSFVAFVGLGLLALVTFIRLLSPPASNTNDASEGVAT
jgi:disulfide bond formation protein DsbB